MDECLQPPFLSTWTVPCFPQHQAAIISSVLWSYLHLKAFLPIIRSFVVTLLNSLSILVTSSSLCQMHMVL
jgi:hypothetical protein